MPTGSLPSDAKDLYEKVYKKYRDEGMSEEEAAKRAWGAVKNAGYSKGEDGKWHKKSDLSEFSLVMLSVGINKDTGERFWKASTSDILPDSYNDEMSLRLYESFISRIDSGILPPEQYRSEAWQGGMPYVSVAHFREHSIAGDTEKVYVDGDVLKARGTFRNTPLGLACFNALCDDLYGQKKANQDRIRVSIAFLDFKHMHKSTGYVFERSETSEVCPECLKERASGTRPGRVFLDGLLIHFAMTRVPVNKRTLMEVEKSMTTKKEDAASIVGKALAEELEEKEAFVSRSELVEKSEEVEKSDDEILEVYRPFGGAVTMAQVKEYAMANKEADRVRDVWYAFQNVMYNIMQSPEIEDKGKALEAAAGELRSMIKNKNEVIFESLTGDDPDEQETQEESSAVTLTEVLEKMDKLESSLTQALTALETSLQARSVVASVDTVASHPLDMAIAQLRSDYDSVALMSGTPTEKLQAIQASFGGLGQEIKRLLSETGERSEAPVQEQGLVSIVEMMQKLSDKVDLLTSQQSRPSPSLDTRSLSIPSPRSINPATVPQIQQPVQQPKQAGPTPVLRSIIDRSVGL